MRIIDIAAAGAANATRGLDASAQRTARLGTPEGASVDPAREVVERINLTQSLKANLEVIRAADAVAGTLLDMIT